MPDPTYPEDARASVAPGNLLSLLKPQIKVEGKKSPIRVKAGGTVEIRAEGKVERFVILMEGATPFEGDIYWAGGDRAKPLKLTVKRSAYDEKDGRSGTRYAFDIMILTANGRVRSTDPDIIVGPMTR